MSRELTLTHAFKCVNCGNIYVIPLNEGMADCVCGCSEWVKLEKGGQDI
jgi:hypothetical protein